jgi:hypothetical protein
LEQIVIGIVVSDLVHYPAAGDIFTALELGHALSTSYDNIIIRYICRQSDYYNIEVLYDLNVLIVLLDTYDLSRLLTLHTRQPYRPSGESSNQRRMSYEADAMDAVRLRHLKPTLVTVAWIRNWFHRWLTRPFIGNYDMLLLSSHLSLAFYQEVMNVFGLQTSCIHSCPSMKVSDDRLREVLEQEKLSYPAFKDALAEIEHTAAHPAQEAKSLAAIKLLTKVRESIYRQENISMKEPTLFSHRVKSKLVYFPLATGITEMPEGKLSEEEEKARSLFEKVDYLFSGSYFHNYREIMSFDPSHFLISNYTGRVAGENWNRISHKLLPAFNSIVLNRLPYEVIRHSYKYVKVVIDDANHVTKPFGSTNSRVFDAVVSGAMVVSNGWHGMEEVFGAALQKRGLKLPVYSSISELYELLSYYLSNNEIRRDTVEVMREVIMKHHTYKQRAEDMVLALGEVYSFQFVERTNVESVPRPGSCSNVTITLQASKRLPITPTSIDFAHAKAVKDAMTSSAFYRSYINQGRSKGKKGHQKAAPARKPTFPKQSPKKKAGSGLVG